MQGKSVTIGIRVPEEMRKRLMALAKAENRTLSQYAMLILRDYLEKLDRAEPGRQRRD
jgi:predicted DNA-binding protein